MKEQLQNEITTTNQQEVSLRDYVEKYLDRTVDYVRGSGRWAKLTVIGGAAVGTGLLASACGADVVQPTLLQLNQGSKIEQIDQRGAVKEFSVEERAILSRTVSVMEQFVNLDEEAMNYLQKLSADPSSVAADLIRTSTSKKNTGGAISIMELYSSGLLKRDQASILRTEVNSNSKGETVSERYRFGFNDQGGLVVKQAEEHIPKRVLGEDLTTGQFVEADEDALGPTPIEISLESLKQKAQRLVRGIDEKTVWNELQNQRDTRFVDGVSSSDIKLSDGSVVRFIIYSSDIAEVEITFPQHQPDPIKRPPLPGSAPQASMSFMTSI